MSFAIDSAILPDAPLAWRVPAARTEPLLSRRGYLLFLGAAAYLVVPLLDVPFWNVSLSTPLLLLVAYEVFLGRSASGGGGYSGWIALAGLLWAGQFLSLLGNVFGGEVTSVSGFVRTKGGYLHYAAPTTAYILNPIT